MLHDNHYDVAFQAYLRKLRIPHVVVDESRRALLSSHSLKSFDFIVSPPDSISLLVDVKGRRFPSGKDGQGNCWENWVTEDDISSLIQWQEIFGSSFRSLLVFVYDLHDPSCFGEFEETYQFRRKTYACCGVWADEYRNEMRVRSTSWQTVTLPRRVFHELKQPFTRFLASRLVAESGITENPALQSVSNPVK